MVSLLTRAQEIADLQQRYFKARRMRRHKAAEMIYVRLRSLMNKQLRAEQRRRAA